MNYNIFNISEHLIEKNKCDYELDFLNKKIIYLIKERHSIKNLFNKKYKNEIDIELKNLWKEFNFLFLNYYNYDEYLMFKDRKEKIEKLKNNIKENEK